MAHRAADFSGPAFSLLALAVLSVNLLGLHGNAFRVCHNVRFFKQAFLCPCYSTNPWKAPAPAIPVLNHD